MADMPPDDQFRPLDETEIIITPPGIPVDPPEDAAAKIAIARALMRECGPIAGTPAALYLSSRSIDPAALPGGVVGWHGPSGAILFVANDANGKVQAVQRVYLTPDGTKANRKPVKQTNGPLKGAAMTLPGNGGEVLLCEGPEDALSLWQATGQPVRCAFGISALGEVPLPADAVAVLVADNDAPDSPTHAAIRKAINRLVERGFAVKLTRPPAGVKDSNDLLRDQGAEAVTAMVAAAVAMEPPTVQQKTANKVKAPAGYRMGKDGLWWVPNDPEKPSILVSGPFEVQAETRNDHGEAWGVLIAWNDNDSRHHEWALPRNLLAGDASEVRARLLDRGLYVAPSNQGRQLLTSYLIAAKTDARARCVDATGWHGAAYVTPGRVYGDTSGERVILQAGGSVADFDCVGTLEGWQSEVAALAVGNSRLALALSVAFVGPLLHLVGEESHGFHFSGGSSSGKTTALRLASSAWGIPIHTWRTTDNAAEGLARAANDGLLLLDELSQVDGRAADAMAYMLGNGQGKGRMRKDSTNKPVASWRLAFLSTGEVGLAEKIGETGKKAKAGQSVRLIEIPADAGAGHKMFDTLHSFDGGDALARHLRTATERHRGHAGRLLLEQITADLPALADALSAEKAEWLAHHLPAGADGQVSRVASRFALAAAAGQLATDIGICPWPEGEAARAAAVCFRAWLDRRGGVGAAETEAGLSQVRAFIEAHGVSRFQPIGSETDTRILHRAGFRRLGDGGRWEYLVLPETWKGEVCKGQDARAIAKDLIARKLLLPGGDGKASRTEYIPGVGRSRVYLLTADILEGGE
ncbi:MAG: DUF927 domain-containing protein [Rhodospirillaceae bacterium]|nr:DUF927 domain-containing protein [Rhodospirillales bacterium]